MSKVFYFEQFSLVQCSVSIKTVLFQTIQLSISTQFSSNLPIDMTLSSATIPGLSGPESDGDEGVFRIPLSSSITGTSPFRPVLLLGLVFWPRLGDLFLSQNPRGVFESHSPGQILGCAYIICSYGQILISCTILNGSPCPPSRVYSYTLSVLICCIYILCD